MADGDSKLEREVVAWLRANNWRYGKAAKEFELDADLVRGWGRRARGLDQPAAEEPSPARAREDRPQGSQEPATSYPLQMDARETLVFEIRRLDVLIALTMDQPKASTERATYVRLQGEYAKQLAAMNEAARDAPEDLGGLDEEALIRDLVGEAEGMPEQLIRPIVDVYLARHRLRLERDESKLEVIGGEKEEQA